MVKHIIALHGGAVQAHSEGLSKGSVFTVALPLLKRQGETSSGPGERYQAEQTVRSSELR